ncbi:hypothetical protein Tco_0872853 [Tanacetum coccineum]
MQQSHEYHRKFLFNDNEIDFRISFDESDDEDYTPEVSYFNDLDFFKDFENEFLAIVYNDALTSKLDLLTEPTISPRHIDEFDLKDETSLSECDEEEQNVLYFNDLFPFNVIYPDDLKSDTDNNNKIDIERPSGDMSITPIPDVINVNAQGSNKLSETSHDTSNKFFKTETFIKKLNVNIMACNYLNNGMLLKNLYVPFGIPFDPKLFYKDGINLGQEPSEEIDNVGGVFINLEISKCWSLEISRRLFNTLFAQELKLKNHPEQNIREVFSF